MQKNVPMVIIIEEINNLVNHYNDGKSMDKDMTTQFWRMLDKAVANPNILVIGTANDISKFPEAVKSRFVGNIVKIEGPKTEEERIEVLKFYLQRHNNSCDSEGIKEVVKNTPMLFPRQLEQIVKNAIGIAFARDGKGEITSGDLKESAKKIIEDHKAFPSGPTQWEKFKNAANEIAVPAGVAASVATVVGALKKNNSPDVAAAAANKAAPVVEKAAAFAAQRATVIVKNLEPAGKKIVIILTRAGQEIARRI
jgi:SpoVK/Ycf46/Vps4 family AAA+-type ATPase